MTFTSLSFLSLFLPLSWFIVFISGGRLANAALLLTSLLFYSFNDVQGLAILLISIFWNYSAGILLSRTSNRHRMLVLTFAIAGNLLLLGHFKYATFFILILNKVLSFGHLPSPQAGLTAAYQPLGISFFTFQAISYLIDLYRNAITFDRNLIRFGLYLAVFPHLIAGPIIRYGDIASQLLNRHLRIEIFANGLRRFVRGLAKKMLLANVFAVVANRIFDLPADQLGQATAWLGAFLYSLQIYYDFSGYTDMAIGIGNLFGFQFPENFNFPYAASSIRDFWRRWHITLSSWFRDYLYIPLGGSRCSEIRTHLNLIMVFVLCGLWHGASWNFLVWGGLHGAFMVAERLGLERLLARGPRLLQHGYVLIVLMTSWVLFRMDNMSEAFLYLRSMFSPSNSPLLSAYPPAFFMTSELFVAITAGVIFSFPWWRALMRKESTEIDATNGWQQRGLTSITADAFLIIILAASLMEIAAGGHHPFIYLQF